jgi:hypothetical protein
MKYYPPPNLGKRAATERFTVAEVLRTGIQISSAVETAHRAGILHRDIKPANILVSQYGEPGLADFGIAGKAADVDLDEDLGISIPWSPPEVLSGASNGTVASDVYSLAATLWHLLVGRSPYELPGGDNTPRALMGRVLRSATPATGRADVPASLERLLKQAMSKQPEQRPASALEFAQSLQGVEQGLRFPKTVIVVEGPATSGPPPARPRAATAGPQRPVRPGARNATGTAESASEPATTQRPSRPSGPASESATTQRPARPSGPASLAKVSFRPEPDGTRLRPAKPTSQPQRTPAQRSALGARPRQGLAADGVAAGGEPATVRRPTAPVTAADESPQAEPERRGVRMPLVVAAVAAVVIIVAVVGTLVMTHKGKTPAETPPSGPVGTDQAGISGGNVQPPKVTASYDAARQSATFTWTRAAGSGIAEPQQYLYSLGDGGRLATSKTTVTVKAADPQITCITVGVLLQNGNTAYGDQTCAQS